MIDHEHIDIYTGPERRRRETLEMEALEAVVERILSKMMDKHEANELAMYESCLTKAFPDGDADAHRAYHQDMIEASKAQKDFWIHAQTKLMEKGIDGIFGVLKVVLMLALAGLAVKVGVAIPFVGGDK